MAITIFLSLSAISFMLFITTPKNLHLFEIIMAWIIIIFIHENVLTVLSLNFSTIEMPKKWDKIMALFFERVFLIPVIIIWFFNKISIARTFRFKIKMLIMITCILVGIEYLAEGLGIIRYLQWKASWTLIEWPLIMMIAFLVKQLFKSVFNKEVKI